MVIEADEGSTEENFQIRAALESLGASLAADKIDEAGVKRLEELNAQMRPPASRRTRATPNSTGNSI